ncbi:MAG: hypothetical protein STSR0008_20910 [Ignavibacterium sp.]
MSNLNAQRIEEKKNKIDSLFTLVKVLTPEGKKDVYDHKLVVNDKNLEKVKKLIYDSYAYAPIEFEREFYIWVQEWKSNIKQGIKSAESVSPGKRIGKIKEAIAEKYDWEYVRFLETPYVMRVKIRSIKNTVYESYKKDGIKLSQVEMEAEIIEILKGEQSFKNGDKIIVSYLPIWYSDCNCPVNFEVNSEYVLPLKHWYFKENKEFNHLLIKNNGMQHFLKIENERLVKPFISDSDFESSWSEFKYNFNKHYSKMGE